MPDGEAARRIGLNPHSILRRRRRLRIPAYKPTPKPRPAKSNRLIGRGRKSKRATVSKRKRKTWTSAEIALLGTDADLEIANKLGRTTWASKRKGGYVEFQRSATRGDGSRLGARSSFCCLSNSDAEIANLLRRDVEEVAAMRRRLRVLLKSHDARRKCCGRCPAGQIAGPRGCAAARHHEAQRAEAPKEAWDFGRKAARSRQASVARRDASVAAEGFSREADPRFNDRRVFGGGAANQPVATEKQIKPGVGGRVCWKL